VLEEGIIIVEEEAEGGEGGALFSCDETVCC
jgi:hypothetical protein